MKLGKVIVSLGSTVSTPGSGVIQYSSGFIAGSRNRESQDKRNARIAAFFNERLEAKQVLVPLGRLLDATMAQHILDGNAIEIGETLEVSINGKDVALPIAGESQSLSKKTFAIWGCIACGSAHGTGVRPSPSVSAKSLATNEFFYDVRTKQLTTISSTCKTDYFSPARGIFGVYEPPAPTPAAPAAPATPATPAAPAAPANKGKGK